MPRLEMVLATAIVTAAAALAGQGAAQAAYPEGPVRIVVPFPPGGAADFMARVLADELSRELDGTFVVENRPGASGIVGTELVAKAAPDGYTLILGSVSTHATNISMFRSLPYHPVDDFTAISLVSMVPSILVVTDGLPVASVEELVHYARENPGTINFASNGIGTTQHLSGEILKTEAGIDIVHVPYRGQDQLVPDLAAGVVHITFNNITAVQGQIDAGNVRPLAVGLPERWPGLPDVATFEEAGLPEVRTSSWLMLLGPDGLPEDVRDILADAVNAVLEDPSARQKFLGSGNMPVGGTSAEALEFQASEVDRWRDIIANAGVEPQ